MCIFTKSSGYSGQGKDKDDRLGLARLLSALFSCMAVVDGMGMGVDVGVPLGMGQEKACV
jgi:hypothetical protein